MIAPYCDERAGSAGRIIPPNKRTYQQDPANYREALREAELDEAEGADIMMVKPGMPYLDIIRALRDNSTLPIAAYHVSGAWHTHEVLQLPSCTCRAVLVGVSAPQGPNNPMSAVDPRSCLHCIVAESLMPC